MPHQGLTNVTIAGFDDVSRTTKFMRGAQLDAMAANGVWVVTQDNTGTIFTRHQLTTDTTDLNSREDSMVANMDSLSYTFLTFFRNNRYIGRSNITDRLVAQLGRDFGSLVTKLIDDTAQTTIGPQLEAAQLTTLQRDPVDRSAINATVEVVMPAPFNNFNIHLVAVTTLTAATA
jgi:hypothetical protein